MKTLRTSWKNLSDSRECRRRAMLTTIICVLAGVAGLAEVCWHDYATATDR